MKTQIVPVVIGALGVVRKGIERQTDKYQETSTLQNCKVRSIRVSAGADLEKILTALQMGVALK